MKEAIVQVQHVLSTDLLRVTEVEIAALIRETQLDNEQLWTRAENFGLAVITNLEEFVPTFDPDDVDGVTDRFINLAAHTLWSTARRRFLRNDVYEAAFLGLNAGILFLYAANISGAAAIAHEMQEWPIDDSIFVLIRNALGAFKVFPLPSNYQLITTICHYYQALNNHQHADVPSIFDLISSDVQVPERRFKDAHFALIYRLEQAIPWLAKFLLPSLLDGFLGQRTNYTDYIRQNGPFFAFPSQRHALAQLWGLPRANTLINYPTSTGKTLIGELLAIEPLLKGQSGVAVYIAPYRAIVSQIVDRDRKRIEAAGITFIRAMGGYMEGLAEIPIADKILLVATPEAFDYVLRVTPQLGERLVAVAIDELHLIEQPGRGTLLECLVGRLRDLQQTQPLHIIGLSAVLSETTNIQQWLDIPDSHILRTTWTPARKRFEIQLPKKRALFYGDPASATQSTESSEIRWEFASGVAKIPFLDDPTRQRQRDAAFNKIADRAAYMAVEMYTKFQGAVLIVCATKRDTRIVARHLLSHLEPEEIRATWVDKLKTVIQQRYPHHQTLLRMLPYRVCYHNADLEYEVRDLLQRLIENHYFKVVVATTTLAEGVDLPFRAVIMHRWTHYAGSGKRSLFSTLLMRNITGRCGRAGMFVEGDTIFFDNPVDDPLYNRPRKELLEAMYIDPPTVRLRSSIQLNDAENGSKVEAQLESAFLALVNQHQPVEQPAERLADVLLCDKTIAGQVQGHLNRVLSAELRRGPTALLTANSPIRLTSYGRAAVQTGLSVRSASEIARLLPELATPYTKPSDKSTIMRQLKLHWNGWFDKIFSLLQGLEELGEREFPVKKDDRILLLWGWYSGWSAPAIVWLTYYRKENVNIPEVEWLRSPSEANPELEDKIAEVQGFCESYFSQGWARILRAVQTFLLVDDSSRTEQTLAEYEQLTPCISRGVYTSLAAQFLETSNKESFPGERTHAQLLADWYVERGITTVAEVQAALVQPKPSELADRSLDPIGISSIELSAAAEMCNWLIELKKASRRE